MAKTRLAPSPTGALHLGNARTFLINWLLARQEKWEVILRIEDLDGPRIKAGAAAQLMDDLQFLGLDWDEGPAYQSSRSGHYQAIVEWFLEQGLAYPCICSRKEVELAASAPHAEDGATVYPGTCRGKYASMEDARQKSGREPAVRFMVPDQLITFEDGFLGRLNINVAKELGDFVIAKSDGVAAYQLAVVVDDLAAQITHVVRGADLLESTPRQMLIYAAMNMESQIPQYIHLPLVLGTDGLRLAKRHGDTRISMYRELGVPASRILAVLARWCGIDPEIESVPKAESLIGQFDLKSLSREPIIFTAADDAFLREGI